MKPNFTVLLIILISGIFNACKKDFMQSANSVSSKNISNDDGTPSPYFLNPEISTPKEYIATNAGGEVTAVFTTFKKGLIDSLYISVTKMNKATFSAMYANGNQVIFGNSSIDTIGRVKVDLTGDTVSGISIPIRTIFKIAGQGFSSGIIFSLVMQSMRINGITYKQPKSSQTYKLVGTKPQLDMEKTASVNNGKSDTLAILDLGAVGGTVIYDSIPIGWLTTASNVSIKPSSLKVINGQGNIVAKVSGVQKIGNNDYSATINLVNSQNGGYRTTGTKLFLLGVLNYPKTGFWEANFSYGMAANLVWQDLTLKRFTGTSNTAYLEYIPDDYKGAITYP